MPVHGSNVERRLCEQRVGVVHIERYTDRKFDTGEIARCDSAPDRCIHVGSTITAGTGAILEIDQHDIPLLPAFVRRQRHGVLCSRGVDHQYL